MRVTRELPVLCGARARSSSAGAFWDVATGPGGRTECSVLHPSDPYGRPVSWLFREETDPKQ